MVSTFKSLKCFFQTLKRESNNNKTFIPIILVLITIPLANVLNNIAIVLLFIVSIVFSKKEAINFKPLLLFPILLYLLMVASVVWSINKSETLIALIKELPLLLIPLVFTLLNEFSKQQKQKIIACYSYFITIVAIFYLFRALIRYGLIHDIRVFFYHGGDNDDYGLVPKLLNAIHVSIFSAIAFFYFLTKEVKSKTDIFCSSLLLLFILALSSKNIILILILLILIYIFFFSKTAHKMRLRNLIVLGLLVVVVFSTGRIKNRIQVEFQKNSPKSWNANVIEDVPKEVHYVSIKEAWTNVAFAPNDYFPGTAFRVYQFRVFIELIQENHNFFTGFGLNASYSKIKEKAKKYNLFFGYNQNNGYQNKNFHNQYIQNFAELGVFGFLSLVIMLIINFKNALKSKDFVHFAFAILMISLFLTESFLWRQRGVVFFTMMYCLFNSGIIDDNSKLEEKS